MIASAETRLRAWIASASREDTDAALRSASLRMWMAREVLREAFPALSVVLRDAILASPTLCEFLTCNGGRPHPVFLEAMANEEMKK